MRIILLSDIHGNSIALDAVLNDIKTLGTVDLYLILGDLCALGYDPVGALTRLIRLPDARYARGNTDHYLVSEAAINELTVKAENNQGIEKIVPILRSLSWTQGAITAAGWINWMAAIPMEQRLVLPDGTRLLGVHAAPGHIDGDGIHPGLSEEEVRQLIANCEADLVCVGHTHCPLDISVDGVRIVNLGSVSNPKPPDLRATYAVLDADANGYQIQLRHVDYDHAAVVECIDQARIPADEYLRDYILGRHLPEWTPNQNLTYHEYSEPLPSASQAIAAV